MGLIGAIIGAVIGGLVGAGIWAGVSAVTDHEIGWIAWGIGALVGGGALVGAAGKGNMGVGAVAAIVALLAVLAGKFWAIHLVLANEVGTNGSIRAELEQAFQDPEYVLIRVADDIITERVESGQAVDWPNGGAPGRLAEPNELPPDVWAEAQQRWSAWNSDQQQQYIDYRLATDMQEFDAAMGEVASMGFEESFSALDILWFFLAVGTAFKLGASTSK